MKRIVYAASAEAQRFGDLHDSGDWDKYSSTYDQMYHILDRYGTENDSVADLYDRASKDEQRSLMALAESVNASPGKSDKSAFLTKYNKLLNAAERGHTSSYEDGWIDGISELADAYGIDL